MKAKNYINEITLIIISYRSYKKIKDLIKKKPKKLKVIIIENSNDNKINKLKNENIKIFKQPNKGISSSINFACKKVKTKYFFNFSPDIKIKNQDINRIYIYAKHLKDNFGAIGPRFINVNPKSHKQSNMNIKLSKINAIHGSAMFMKLKNYYKIGKFDENLFLFYEENDFCKRANKKKYFCYQANEVKVKNNIKGSIAYKNTKERKNIENLYTWHFVWSKFYFIKKHYGFIVSIIYFTPVIFRIMFRILLHSVINKNKKNKYLIRLNGLAASIVGKKSYLRPKDIIL